MLQLKRLLAFRLVWVTRRERVPDWLRNAVLGALGVEVAAGVRMRHGVEFLEYRTRIAERVFIGASCYFEDHAPVTIGPDVWIAAHSRFFTATHAIGGPARRAGDWRSEPITVGAGCWIGANVTVLPGVTIGPGCVIAAGSVVREDCAANGLYAGVPASRRRELGDAA